MTYLNRQDGAFANRVYFTASNSTTAFRDNTFAARLCDDGNISIIFYTGFYMSISVEDWLLLSKSVESVLPASA